MRGGGGKLTGGFISIIVFKYFKAVVFLLAGILALRLGRGSPLPTAREIARYFRSSPENELIRAVAAELARTTPREYVGLGILSIFAALIFAVEGTLLSLRIWWSTYFTITLTTLGIPLELFEIGRSPHSIRRYVIFAVNVVILVYLWRRRNEFREDFPIAARR